jgi:penicillin-binding protein 1C
VTLADIATLYAMLANHGEWAPLRYRSDAARLPRTRVLSEAASFVTLEMLRAAPLPPEFARPGEGLRTAWKAGTSAGLRDAWTAGALGPYVLVVWVGNFDGSGHPAFTGHQAAAPLFFHLLEALSAADPRLLEPMQQAPVRLARIQRQPDHPGRRAALLIAGHEPLRLQFISPPRE